MNFVWVFSYLTDSLFMWLYFCRSTYAPNRQRPLLKPFLLLLFLPLYLNTTVLEIPYASVRVLLRIIIWFLWCCFAEGVPWRVSIYAALFWTAAYTLFQNLFFGPYLNDAFMGIVDVFPSHLGSQVLLSVVTVLTRIAYFGVIAWLLPFAGMVGTELSHICLASLLCFVAAYIKSTGTPLLSEFSTAPAQFSTYYILLHLAVLLVLIAAELIRRKTVESASLSVQNTTAHALLENIQDRQQNEESLRALRHDLKNHAITLQLLLEQGELEEMNAYLEALRAEASLPAGSFRTGSDLLDGLLKLKLGPAQERGIQTEVNLDFRAGEFIDTFDLCILMGNVLDNALEACLLVEPPEERVIKITGGLTANCLLIKVENSYIGPASIIKSIPGTTKSDKTLHGFGLRNIKRVLERYGGTLTLSAQEGRFIASMLIPIPEDS